MTSHEPILKTHWERYRKHVDINVTQAQKLIAPYCHDAIKNIILLSEGCANTNIKVEFEQRQPIVIRIYLREKKSLAREISLHNLLNEIVPIPKIYYSDDSCSLIEHPYAIMEFVDGILMRNVILSGDKNAIADCSFSAGVYLNHLRRIKFDQGGFFQDNLEIRPFSSEEEYLPFAQSCLVKDHVQESLGTKSVDQLSQFIEANQNYLPNKNNANLTHADFDPSNMLVKEVNGHYQVSAILDWEFAFSGSYLLDIGMFLRYSHKLPTIYEEKFIEGIVSEGDALPQNWKKSAKLMDIICLLSLLYWNPKNERPKLNQDVVSLLQHTVDYWDQF